MVTMVFPHRRRNRLSYRTDLVLRRPAGLLSSSRLGVLSSSPYRVIWWCLLLEYMPIGALGLGYRRVLTVRLSRELRL